MSNPFPCVSQAILKAPMRTSISDIFLGVGSGNNYAYIVTDEDSKDAVVIDPSNPPEYVPSPRVGP